MSEPKSKTTVTSFAGIDGDVQVAVEPLPGRLATYAVRHRHADIVVGWLRLDVAGQRWIARTPGTETSAATIRRFPTKVAAVAFLLARDPSGVAA